MNGGGGWFAIVCLIVLIVLGAGYLINEDIDNHRQLAIAQEVELELARQKAALVDENRLLQEENRRLTEELDRVSTDHSNLTARFAEQKLELEIATARLAELESGITTGPLIPTTGEITCLPESSPLDGGLPGLILNEAGYAWPLFSIIGIVLFGSAAIVTARQGRLRGGRRYDYGEDENVVYMKMTRAEAHRYAQSKRNAAGPARLPRR